MYENDENESVGRKNENVKEKDPKPELKRINSTLHGQTQLARRREEEKNKDKKLIRNECTA